MSDSLGVGQCIHGVSIGDDCERCSPRPGRLAQTTVINLRNVRGDPKQIEELVYIGRQVNARGPGQRTWRASPWANPFKPDTAAGDKDLAAGRCVLLYTKALLQRIETIPAYLAHLREKLRGRYLACWCVPYDWKCGMDVAGWCHGIPLCMIAEGQEPREVYARLSRRVPGSEHYDEPAAAGVGSVAGGGEVGRPPQGAPH